MDRHFPPATSAGLPIARPNDRRAPAVSFSSHFGNGFIGSHFLRKLAIRILHPTKQKRCRIRPAGGEIRAATAVTTIVCKFEQVVTIATPCLFRDSWPRSSPTPAKWRFLRWRVRKPAGTTLAEWALAGKLARETEGSHPTNFMDNKGDLIHASTNFSAVPPQRCDRRLFRAAAVTDADIPQRRQDLATSSASACTQGQRHSPMTQINTNTVKNLVPAWSMSFLRWRKAAWPGIPAGCRQRQDVRHRHSRLFAIDAKTGKKLWKYEHRLPDGIMPCCDVINRGAALYDNLVIRHPGRPIGRPGADSGKVVWKEKPEYAAGLLCLRRSHHRQRSPACLAVNWHRRVASTLATPRPASWSGPVRLLKATWATLRRLRQQDRKRHFHHQRHLAWRHVEDRRCCHPERRHLRSGNQPDLRGHRQPCSVEQPYPSATTCSPVPPWPSTPTPARSPGTIRTPRMTAGTLTANEFDSDLGDPKTGKMVKAGGGKADRNGFFFVNDRTNGKLLNAFPSSSRRPGPRAST